MSLTLSQSDAGTFELPPAGATGARCCAVVDLGSQESTFQGKTKRQPKLLLTFELSESRSDGTPHRVSRRLTASLHPKSQLRAFLEQWRGRPFTETELDAFNVAKLAGAPCLLNMAHVERGGKQYANILSVSPLPKGMAAPELSAPAVVFDLANPDWPAFAGLSSRLQETVAASPEYQAAKVPKSVPLPAAPTPASAAYDERNPPPNAFGDFDDDIPF